MFVSAPFSLGLFFIVYLKLELLALKFRTMANIEDGRKCCLYGVSFVFVLVYGDIVLNVLCLFIWGTCKNKAS